MKRLTAIIMTLALLACGFALAEADDGSKINCLIEDGSFIIQIDDPEGDLGWLADDMSQDDSVVKLYDADLIEDTFVVRYDPVGDGDVTVGVRHYNGIACDEAHTWDLHVENGAVTECTGGSYTAAPADEESDPYMIGQWAEAETQFAGMTIEKNPERGWDIAIVSPVSHGAYVFKTSVLFDCDRNGFVYDKGKFWDIDGEYDGETELGEARTAGTTGIFTFVGDDQNLILSWHDDVENPEGEILFERVDAEATVD